MVDCHIHQQIQDWQWKGPLGEKGENGANFDSIMSFDFQNAWSRIKDYEEDMSNHWNRKCGACRFKTDWSKCSKPIWRVKHKVHLESLSLVWYMLALYSTSRRDNLDYWRNGSRRTFDNPRPPHMMRTHFFPYLQKFFFRDQLPEKWVRRELPPATHGRSHDFSFPNWS